MKYLHSLKDSLALQLILGVNRNRKYKNIKIMYGSQWFSITDDLAEYIISKEKNIYKIFKYTNCADELFVQTIVYNSKFIDRLYDKKFDDSIKSNMRLIDMKKRGKNGNPYTWKITDWNEIKSSDCLFARKFDESIDSEIIRKVISKVKTDGYD